jgi:cell division septal protein FtsQ
MDKQVTRVNSTLLAIALSLVIVSGGAYLLGWSSLLTVKNVAVEGSNAESLLLSKLRSEEIVPEIGSRLARIETRAIMGSLNQLDWLKSVAVERKWLSQSIVIRVTEKSAVARAVINQNTLINFDVNGEIFKPTSAEQVAFQQKLPLVNIQNPSTGQLAKVALLIDKIPPNMNELISNLISMSVSESGLVQMQTKINDQLLQIYWGQLADIEEKCQVLEALLRLPENKEINRVDLSQPDLPIVS